MPARHARSRPARRLARPVVAIAAIAAGGAGTLMLGCAYAAMAGGSPPALADAVRPGPVALARLPVTAGSTKPALLPAVTVAPGDVLSRIAVRLCGTAADTLALAYNNHLASPDRITAGQVIRARCTAPAAAVAAAYPPPSPPGATAVAATSARSNARLPAVAAAVVPAGDYGCSALEGLWDAAGGNPADALIAARVATAESGGNPDAISPTDDYGLWQINASNGALATLSPSGSAHSAVVLSDDGTNWSAWTTFTDGAYAAFC